MIKSFSSVSAFQKQIMEINSAPKASVAGYYWRKRGAQKVLVYYNGKSFAETDTYYKAAFLVRDHAKRIGIYRILPLPEHYFQYIDGVYRLYVNGRFSKKGSNKAEILDWLEIYTWIGGSEHAKSWGRK